MRNSFSRKGATIKTNENKENKACIPEKCFIKNRMKMYYFKKTVVNVDNANLLFDDHRNSGIFYIFFVFYSFFQRHRIN